MVERRRLQVLVRQIRNEAERIRSYELVDPTGAALPAFTAGAHLDVWLPSGLARSYSLANDPAETDRYVIAVQREVAGRGGSAEMHDKIGEGATIEISAPLNNFLLAPAADHHRLIAGGIGITPILSMVRELQRRGEPWTLHYCSRQPEHTAFRDVLTAETFAGRVQFHHDGGDPSKGLDLKTLLQTPRAGEHVYCCGPTGFMEAVKRSMAHWPAGSLHLEYFTAAAPVPVAANDTFEVEIASSGQVFEVPPDRSILQVLEDNGIEVESVCCEGVCGTCAVQVVEGIPDHRDVVFDDEMHASNKWITVCCSRSHSKRLKLAL
ncbi:MAG: PDR/VanB family oxidoreductase [Dongiaceae bacterium]